MDRQNEELRKVENLLPGCLREPEGKHMSQINLLKTATAYIWTLSLAYEIGVSLNSEAFQVGLKMINEARNSRWQIHLIDTSPFDYLFDKDECSFFYKLKTRMYGLRQVIVQSAVRHASHLLNIFSVEASSSVSRPINAFLSMHDELGVSTSCSRLPMDVFSRRQDNNKLRADNPASYWPILSSLAESSHRPPEIQPVTWLNKQPTTYTSAINYSNQSSWSNQGQVWQHLPNDKTGIHAETEPQAAPVWTNSALKQTSGFLSTPSVNHSQTQPTSLFPSCSFFVPQSPTSCSNQQITSPSDSRDFANNFSALKTSEYKTGTVNFSHNDMITPDVSSDFVEIFNSATTQEMYESISQPTSYRSSCRYAQNPPLIVPERASCQFTPQTKVTSKSPSQRIHGDHTTTPSSNRSTVSLGIGQTSPFASRDEDTPCTNQTAHTFATRTSQCLTEQKTPDIPNQLDTCQPNGTPVKFHTSPLSSIINASTSTLTRRPLSNLQNDSGIGSDLESSDMAPVLDFYSWWT